MCVVMLGCGHALDLVLGVKVVGSTLTLYPLSGDEGREAYNGTLSFCEPDGVDAMRDSTTGLVWLSVLVGVMTGVGLLVCLTAGTGEGKSVTSSG